MPSVNEMNFETVIKTRGQLVYTNVGDSMYPLIQPRDLLVIKALEEPLKQYDIPLYKRDNGQYVLHRIMRIKNGEYIMCGDNRCCPELGITDRHIIGVLTDIIRDGKTIPVEPPNHSLWFKSMMYRRIVFKIKKWKRQIK